MQKKKWNSKQEMIKNYTNGDQNTTLLQLLYRTNSAALCNQSMIPKMMMRSWTNEIDQRKSVTFRPSNVIPMSIMISFTRDKFSFRLKCLNCEISQISVKHINFIRYFSLLLPREHMAVKWSFRSFFKHNNPHDDFYNLIFLNFEDWQFNTSLWYQSCICRTWRITHNLSKILHGISDNVSYNKTTNTLKWKDRIQIVQKDWILNDANSLSTFCGICIFFFWIDSLGMMRNWKLLKLYYNYYILLINLREKRVHLNDLIIILVFHEH